MWYIHNVRNAQGGLFMKTLLNKLLNDITKLNKSRLISFIFFLFFYKIISPNNFTIITMNILAILFLFGLSKGYNSWIDNFDTMSLFQCFLIVTVFTIIGNFTNLDSFNWVTSIINSITNQSYKLNIHQIKSLNELAHIYLNYVNFYYFACAFLSIANKKYDQTINDKCLMDTLLVVSILLVSRI